VGRGWEQMIQIRVKKKEGLKKLKVEDLVGVLTLFVKFSNDNNENICETFLWRCRSLTDKLK
jgi:hypothetical protein